MHKGAKSSGIHVGWYFPGINVDQELVFSRKIELFRLTGCSKGLESGGSEAGESTESAILDSVADAVTLGVKISGCKNASKFVKSSGGNAGRDDSSLLESVEIEFSVS